MQRITFAQIGNWIITSVMLIGRLLDRVTAGLVFACDLTLISIALFFYCLVMRTLPTQVQEQELLSEYEKGVAFGRKDTLEKLTQLGAAFKVSSDGQIQAITEETAAAASQTNKQLSS